MELAQKAKKVIVLMNQTDKYGNPKIVDECTLPLTSARCVNMIITEMAVFQISSHGLTLTDLFTPYSINEVRAKTGCSFTIAENVRVIN